MADRRAITHLRDPSCDPSVTRRWPRRRYLARMSVCPRLTEVERLFFCSDLVAVGAFRCPADHPLFVDSGPTTGHVLVFPRTSTEILRDGGGTVTGAPPTVLFYNRGQAYRRRKIDAMDA